MISRRNKISAADFPRSGAMLFHIPYGIVKAKRNEKGIIRVGVVIGASAARRAVLRNFWKRHFYDTLFRFAPRGYDILLIAGRGLKDLDPKKLEIELAPIFKRFPVPHS